jgi:L-iditol 2-dehydrogenase
VSATMRAAVLHGPEDVRMEDVPVPVPGPGEVVVRVRAALTCGTDVKVFRRGYHARMITPPALFGHEMAGTVEAVGAGVEAFVPGGAVVTANSAPCGACPSCAAGRESLCEDLLFWNGAYAEQTLLPARIVAKNLLPLPEGLPFRRAALTEPLACVVRGVSGSRIEAGQTVAVIGSGPVGLMFVRLAALAGARVVVAGRRKPRLDTALAMGAAAVVDAADSGWEAALRRETPGGHDRPARRRPPALRGDHGHVELPPHAGERARGAAAHRDRRPRRRPAHHAGAPARRRAGGAGGSGTRERRPQDGDRPSRALTRRKR